MEEKNIADEYKVRQDKLNKLKKEGYTPFKRNFKTTHFSSDIKEIDVNDFRDKELVLKKPKRFLFYCRKGNNNKKSRKNYFYGYF